jgi:hypothetical protein
MTAVSQERALVLLNRWATWLEEVKPPPTGRGFPVRKYFFSMLPVMNPFVRDLLCRQNIAVNLETTEGLYDGISRITSIA